MTALNVTDTFIISIPISSCGVLIRLKDQQDTLITRPKELYEPHIEGSRKLLDRRKPTDEVDRFLISINSSLRN